MPAVKPKTIKFRDGFPYFAKSESTEFLIKAHKLPVSDIWGLWHYIIRTVKKRYGAKFNIDYLETLLEQAQYFFEAASNAPMKSQPLLYYYSFLNLTKAYLNIEVNGITDSLEFYHGIESCKITSGSKLGDVFVEVKSLINNPPAIGNTVSVAYQLSQRLGDNYKKIAAPSPGYDNGPWRFSVESLLMSCIGIHRTVSQTFHSIEDFINLENPILLKSGRTLTFQSEIEASSKHRTKLSAAGYNLIADGAKWSIIESYILPSNNVTKKDLKSLNDILVEKGIWSYCAQGGYRFYISPYSFVKDAADGVYKYQIRTAGDSSIKLSSLSVIYFLMFFFGSITRYHPYLFEKVLSDKEIWIVSEFLKTQPKQYLHLLTSKVLATPVLFSKMQD